MKDQKNGGILLSYLNTALSMGMNLVLIPMLISALTDDGYSLYKVIQSFAGPLMMFNLGMSTVVARCVARYRAVGTEEGRKEKENTFAVAVLISGAMALLVVAAGLGMTALVPVLFGKTYSSGQLDMARKLLMIFAGTTALHILDDTFRGCVLGRERFYFLYGTTTLRYLLRFGSILLLTRLPNISAVAVALVDFVLFGLSLTANILYCRFRLRERLRVYTLRRREFAAITSFSAAVLLQAVVNQVNTHVDTVILGAMVRDTGIITMYSCALSIFAVYQSLISVLTGVYLPKAARLVAQGSSGQVLTDFVIPPGRLQAVIAVAVLGGFGLFGRRFIRLWIGAQYQQAYFVALALMLPVTVPLVQNVCLSILNAKLKQLFRSLVLTAMAALNVCVSLCLVRSMGYWGAAIGTVLALLLGNGLAMNLYYARVLGLNVARMLRGIFSGILPAGLVSCLVCAPLALLPGDTVWNLLGGCLVFVGIYGICLWKLGLNPEEKKWLLARLPHAAASGDGGFRHDL